MSHANQANEFMDKIPGSFSVEHHPCSYNWQCWGSHLFMARLLHKHCAGTWLQGTCVLFILMIFFSDLGRFPMPENTTLDLVFGDNSRIHVQYIALIGVPPGHTLRSLLTSEYDVKNLVKLAENQRLFRQFLQAYSEDSNVPSALTSSLPPRARRRRRQTSSPAYAKGLLMMRDRTYYLL